MLPKEASFTKSRALNTNKPRTLDTPIQFVKGVGPGLGKLLSLRGISTVAELLQFFPRTYEDRTRFFLVREMREHETVTTRLKPTAIRKIPVRGGRKTILEVRCVDDEGTPISLKWFHYFGSMEKKFVIGQEVILTGTPKKSTQTFGAGWEMIHPEFLAGKAIEDSNFEFGRLVPIYSELEGIPSKTFRKILWNALQDFGDLLKDDLPEFLLTKHQLPSYRECIEKIHFPSESGLGFISQLNQGQTIHQQRLIYEEFFKFEYFVLKRRLNIRKSSAAAFQKDELARVYAELKTRLPFQLTQDQTKTLGSIFSDLSEPHPMNRLLQGDVGSGKTIVAFLAMGSLIVLGAQAVLMAPTEILAEQHFNNSVKLFGKLFEIYLLSGKSTTSERKLIQKRLQEGQPLLLIGTHAVLEDPIAFEKLRMIVIDEQHRFGVEQRRTLRKKGGDLVPHTLVMTATPIPRTLALTAYGDLSVSQIRERPPGRTPIKTFTVNETQVPAAYDRIRTELQSGRQVYFIFPLVNESEAEGFEDLKSATLEFERIQNETFPEFKVGLLHGQLTSQEKSEVMQKFKSAEIQILVSTTVVEVGVDVPNATVMVIEHAERFGLSQLHQLRGRVGRGKHQSYCFLFSRSKKGEKSTERLNVLVSTEDGFEIAEADLEIRGPGEFLGTRQAGALPFRLASLIRDQDWLVRARNDVIDMLKDDPLVTQSQYSQFKEYLLREGGIQAERLGS